MLPGVRLAPAPGRAGLAVRRMRVRRPATRWVLDGDSVIDATGRVTELALALPGRANRSNAVVALAVAERLRRRPGPGAAEAARGDLGGRPVHPGGAARAPGAAAAGQEPGRLAGGVRRARARRRCRCCWRSTRRCRTARTRPGCGTWTTGCCAAARCSWPASAGSTSRSGWRPTRSPFELVDGVDDAVSRVPPGGPWT